jgi:ParB family chromosome partitioning protein
MSSQTTRKKASKIGQQLPKNFPSLEETDFKIVAISDIDFSPFNYRKFFYENALNDFASEIALHGIISPLTLRTLPSGRYELVAGERRLRAASIAKLKEVPAVIKVLTNEEVIELQLSENLQRENPHPMHEALGIGQMQKAGKNISEIAARLGKSKAFIYSRLKFLSLIDTLQEMFLADKFNISEAFELASISADSQIEFYQEHCLDWKDNKGFDLGNLNYALSKYKYDLMKAPFNIKDKKLVEEAGACTGCQSNTATLKTLFPEYAKQAICTNRACYNSKCEAYFTLSVISAFQRVEPEALLYSSEDMIDKVVLSVPDAANLPKYNVHEVKKLSIPGMPVKEDYYDEEEEEDDEQSTKNGFAQAMEEYNNELESYNQIMGSGKVLTGLFISHDKIVTVLFTPEPPGIHRYTTMVTAKQVQEAIKQGKATPGFLQSEIYRIGDREERAKEIDREKIQEKVYRDFDSQLCDVEKLGELTEADKAGARLLLFQSLGYSARLLVELTLFPSHEKDGRFSNEALYEVFCSLTDQQYAYLIRKALSTQSDAKSPSTDTGYFLYRMAEAAGVNVAAIEQEQEKKMKERESKMNGRIADLQKKISKLNSAD